MPYLRDIPDALRAGGCRVWEDPGADNRGQGSLVSLDQLFLHHTAGGGTKDWLVVRDGRQGLRGLLSQLTLERDGLYRYLGAGQAWHAGSGGPSKYVRSGQGNSRGLGIEIVSKGCWDCFTHEQKTEIVKGVAALIRWYRLPADAFLAHKEWTSRKIDPAFDMAWIRREVARALGQPSPGQLPLGGEPTLRVGSKGPAVAEVQRLLGIPADGIFGPQTESAVKRFQVGHHLEADGIVGPETWRRLRAVSGGKTTGKDVMPGWYEPKRKDWAGNEQDLNSTMDILDQRLVHIEKRINDTATAILGLHDILMKRLDETHKGPGEESLNP